MLIWIIFNVSSSVLPFAITILLFNYRRPFYPCDVTNHAFHIIGVHFVHSYESHLVWIQIVKIRQFLNQTFGCSFQFFFHFFLFSLFFFFIFSYFLFTQRKFIVCTFDACIKRISFSFLCGHKTIINANKINVNKIIANLQVI